MTVSPAGLFRGVLFLLVLRCVSAGVADEPAAKSPLRIITLGDSITRGVRSRVVANETFAALLEVELRKTGRAVEVLNVGLGGERTDGALARLDKDVIAQ